MNVMFNDLMTHLTDSYLNETRQALNGFHVSVTQLAIAVNGR